MIKISQIYRLFVIQRVLLRHGFDEIAFSVSFLKPFKSLLWLFPWNWFRREYDAKSDRIRKVLEELGPIFVKFGQILSTRRDLMPDDITEGLSRLQDNVPAFPGEEAKKLIESAYGVEIGEIFLKFDLDCVASASIAQVHQAVLHDGTEVIVKVVRPKIKPIIVQDISLMRLMASLVERYWEPGAKLKPSLIVSEVEKTILDELDMFREASNASQLGRNFEGSDVLLVPKVYWEYTRANILVTEKVVGLNVSDLDGLRRAGVNLEQLAVDGLDILFTQIFRDHFFHADLHPGNIFIIPGRDSQPDRYGVVDFGIMGSLSEFDQRYLAQNCSAFLKRDYRRVAELHVESGWVPPETRVDEFETAIRSVCEPIFDKPVKEISLGHLLLRLFQTARRFNMEIQPQLLLLQKTLLGVEGITRDLDPELDMWEAARPAVESFMAEKLKVRNVVGRIREELPTLVARLPETPAVVFDLLDKIRSGKLIVHTRDPSLLLLKEELRRMIAKLVLALTGVGLLLFSVILYVARQSPIGSESIILALVVFLGGMGGGLVLGSILGKDKD
ncbi:MAG: ubiquinone biosynthesis regulatory protein kinase UbiB [Pseudomonadota bacterium]|nr:ubiquinone biosynthesis regulatory protein kinase UbiB [Pseudomonadota bacterium]